MICAFGILVQQVMKRGRNGQGADTEQQTKHQADNGDFADARLQRCCQPALHGCFNKRISRLKCKSDFFELPGAIEGQRSDERIRGFDTRRDAKPRKDAVLRRAMTNATT